MESFEDGELSTKLESELPPELVFAIFDHVPEAIRELRLTSRALQVCVDEFVRQRATTPLVLKISLRDHYDRYDEEERTIKDNEPGTMRIWIYVPVHAAAFFELRLKCLGVVNRSENMWRRGYDITMSGDLGDVNSYFLNCSIPGSNDANATDWAWVYSIGTDVTSVELRIHDRAKLAAMCRIVQRFNLKRLEFYMENLSNGEAGLILKAVKHHKLECLSLRATSITISTLVEFLLELSTHLRKLYLGGNYEREVKWVELIIGMLSRKLDTLHVNHWWREILTREDADRLIVQLPFVGKKVWFKVDFALNTVGRSTKLNGHVIHETCPITRPNKPKKDRALSIIHKSRLNEVSPRGY
ncbi:hypothetical protein PRIPAC_80650 [Pristionchus pacificus]|nr:hypothetical protein PRIPAC_80650 [Pristionchus pacificus]